MLDRKKYEEELQLARVKQIEEISQYLSDYIKLNANIRDLPFTPDDSKKLLDEIDSIEISRNSREVKDIANELIDKVFTKAMLIQHPRFLSFVTSSVSPYSLAGSILTDIYSVNTCGFVEAPGVGVIEAKLIRWMGSLAGFDDKCGGVFTSGGSLSNLTGIICARDHLIAEDDITKAVAYTSDQAHSSIRKGMKLMGLKKDNIKIIPSDDNFKIRLDLLQEEIEKDIKDGKIPFLIVGSLGTTNTGSIDPLDKLGEIKTKYNMWLHVDGAFGGSILFSDIYRNLAKGINNADTFSWDTHKWAMQSYSCSCIIAKDKKKLIETYAEHPEYLADVIDGEHTDGFDLGIEMSRPARCIKLWFTIQAMGTDSLSDVIDYTFFNAMIAEKQLKKYPDFEITSPMSCATLTFRYAPKDIDESKLDDLNALISKTIIEENIAYIVTTTIKNKKVLRLNLINGNTTDQDVIDVIDELNKIACRVHEESKKNA